MKTIVQDFCQEFSTELDPFEAKLNNALDALGEKQDLPQLNATKMGLYEVRQRLSTLKEKIDGQQAFLLIFGPLKSGKSTLMNAISGAYVSEVSSLPAYPALVYVKNGDERRFHATTYSGEKREFRDNLEMAEAVKHDHARLASAILEVERAGEEFDPKQHYPEAIRRMDVEVPAKNLAKSGSVLVDTPGLYSRMKFGYDQMTRDFRDTAACAIFVVKTDNLFFEKVFEEFEELLDCFSRIFLVSNIDKSKKDLKPDGSLEASMESRDPGQVIEAFRSLSMSAPLREAIDDGRISIYPIDLLEAASKRLRANAAQERGDIVEESGEVDESEQGFDIFLNDLTAYLNSSDYMNDFMTDSLRMARDLSNEAGDLVDNQAIEEIERSCDDLKESLENNQKRLNALNKLKNTKWSDAFRKLYDEKSKLLNEQSEGAQEIVENLQNEVSAWMLSDESWKDLIDRRLNGYLAKEGGKYAEGVLKQLKTLIDNRYGGADFTSEQLRNFAEADLRLDEVVSSILPQLGQHVSPPTPSLVISQDEIPLKRSLSDYMMLRSSKQCRAQVFGDDGDAEISSILKQKRLAGAGEEKLRQLAEQFASTDWPQLQQDYVAQLIDQYVAAFGEAMEQKVNSLKTELETAIGGAQGKLQSYEEARGTLTEIKSLTEQFQDALGRVQAQFRVESLELTDDGLTAEESEEDDTDGFDFAGFEGDDDEVVEITNDDEDGASTAPVV